MLNIIKGMLLFAMGTIRKGINLLSRTAPTLSTTALPRRTPALLQQLRLENVCRSIAKKLSSTSLRAHLLLKGRGLSETLSVNLPAIRQVVKFCVLLFFS